MKYAYSLEPDCLFEIMNLIWMGFYTKINKRNKDTGSFHSVVNWTHIRTLLEIRGSEKWTWVIVNSLKSTCEHVSLEHIHHYICRRQTLLSDAIWYNKVNLFVIIRRSKWFRSFLAWACECDKHTFHSVSSNDVRCLEIKKKKMNLQISQS